MITTKIVNKLLILRNGPSVDILEMSADCSEQLTWKKSGIKLLPFKKGTGRRVVEEDIVNE
jgi:hypothetical protein